MNTIKTFLFASPNDSTQVLKITRICTFFNYYIDKTGVLVKKNPPMGSHSKLMYLSDYDLVEFGFDSGKIAREIGAECQLRRMGGVFFDFENPASAGFLAELVQNLARYNLALFVPRAFSAVVSGAKIVIPSSVSGGNFEQMLRDARVAYGEQNICLDIVRTCQDFVMPSYMPDGKALSAAEMQDLMDRYAPSVFFSKDLCSKYFTYRSEDGNSHFVIFDDNSTAKIKLEIAESLGIFSAFFLFSDFGEGAAELLR